MKTFTFVFILALFCVSSEALTDWLQHKDYPCIQCLCHARTGCWLRKNCASYSISKEYWEKAGSLTVTNNENADDAAYKRCMVDENCIVGTIIQYTERFDQKDCNCDGVFDCKDRFAIHLMGGSCENPKYGYWYAKRFNDCAARIGVKEMLTQEGTSDCTGPEVS